MPYIGKHQLYSNLLPLQEDRPNGAHRRTFCPRSENANPPSATLIDGIAQDSAQQRYVQTCQVHKLPDLFTGKWWTMDVYLTSKMGSSPSFLGVFILSWENRDVLRVTLVPFFTPKMVQECPPMDYHRVPHCNGYLRRDFHVWRNPNLSWCSWWVNYVNSIPTTFPHILSICFVGWVPHSEIHVPFGNQTWQLKNIENPQNIIYKYWKSPKHHL